MRIRYHLIRKSEFRSGFGSNYRPSCQHYFHARKLKIKHSKLFFGYFGGRYSLFFPLKRTLWILSNNNGYMSPINNIKSTESGTPDYWILPRSILYPLDPVFWVNADPGFWLLRKNRKILQLKKSYFFFNRKINNCNFLSLAFYEGRPSYRRSLQPSKEVIFAILDLDQHSKSEYKRPNKCGSGCTTLLPRTWRGWRCEEHQWRQGSSPADPRPRVGSS